MMVISQCRFLCFLIFILLIISANNNNNLLMELNNLSSISSLHFVNPDESIEEGKNTVVHF